MSAAAFWSALQSTSFGPSVTLPTSVIDRAGSLLRDKAWRAEQVTAFAKLGFSDPLTDKDIQIIAVTQARNEIRWLKG